MSEVVVLGKIVRNKKNPIVVIDCPFCGNQHTHGAPDGKNIGTRAAHCSEGKEYLIKIVE